MVRTWLNETSRQWPPILCPELAWVFLHWGIIPICHVFVEPIHKFGVHQPLFKKSDCWWFNNNNNNNNTFGISAPPYLHDSMMQKWQQWICFCLVSHQAAREFATFPKSGECRESRGLQGLSLFRYSYSYLEMRDLDRLPMITHDYPWLPMITHDYPWLPMITQSMATLKQGTWRSTVNLRPI